MTRTLPILTFHALDERHSVVSFRPNGFRQGLAALHAEGWRTVGLGKAVECFDLQQALPERSFAITFDDGYRSVYDEALPVLATYGMTATVFLTVGARQQSLAAERLPPLEGREMLSWREIRALHSAGIELGAHTLTHPDLTRLPIETATKEVCESKAVIEDKLGSAVTSFAYPFGRFNSSVREIVARYFTSACSDRLGLTGPRSDRFALDRIDTYYLQRGLGLNWLSSSLFPWYVRARSVPRTIRRKLTSR